MNNYRRWVSMALAVVTLVLVTIFTAPEAHAGGRMIRTPVPYGYYGGGHCGPVYRPPVHRCSYSLQERRVFIGYDQCGRPIYQVYYVQVRTCGCR